MVPGFMENPIRPPFVFESRFAVCSIVWSQATAENHGCSVAAQQNLTKFPVGFLLKYKDNVEYYVIIKKKSIYNKTEK